MTIIQESKTSVTIITWNHDRSQKPMMPIHFLSVFLCHLQKGYKLFWNSSNELHQKKHDFWNLLTWQDNIREIQHKRDTTKPCIIVSIALVHKGGLSYKTIFMSFHLFWQLCQDLSYSIMLEQKNPYVHFNAALCNLGLSVELNTGSI